MKASSTQQLLESFVRQTLERLQVASLLQHGGEVGRAREEALRDHLRSFLPPSLGVSTGFVIDALGGRSRQIDVIIHFADYHAVFKVNGIPLVPVEAVIAVIEVKSDAGSTKVLHESYDNLASCKKLDKSNGGQNSELVDKLKYGDSVDWSDYEVQVFGAVISVKSGTPELWFDATSTWCSGKPRNLWPNFYCGVDDYIGTYHARPRGVDGPLVSWPKPGMALNYVVIPPTGESPLAWATQEILNFVRVARRIDYLPTAYMSAAVTKAPDVLTRPLPPGAEPARRSADVAPKWRKIATLRRFRW